MWEELYCMCKTKLKEALEKWSYVCVDLPLDLFTLGSKINRDLPSMSRGISI